MTLRQSVGVMEFFASLGGAAIVSWVVVELAGPQLTYANNNATNSLVATSNQWFSAVVENLPIIMLFIAVVGSLAFVVYQTRYVG
jgi:hypothetical protein